MSMSPNLWIVPHRHRLAPRKFALGVLSLFLLIAVAVAQPRNVRASYHSGSHAASGSTAEAERQIFAMVNQARQSRGLRPYVYDERLAEAARTHSRRMAAERDLSHQLPGEPSVEIRIGRTGLRFDESGENVAFAADPERAEAALMHSPGHRANILDHDFTAIGVGVVHTSGGIYVTQDFSNRLASASVDDAENTVARMLNQERRAAGSSLLRRIAAPQLRRRACEMAAKDEVDPGAGMLPSVSSAIAFTATDLSRMPGDLRRLRSRDASGFSVGACYRASASYENPVFWILVVTYQP